MPVYSSNCYCEVYALSKLDDQMINLMLILGDNKKY